MINTFSTLIWLELRKFGVFGLGLLLGVAAWFLLARQIFAWTGSNLESAIAVVSTTAFFAMCVNTVLLVGLAQDFWREYRAGRWSLLLGSPQPAWLHLAAKAVFGGAVLSLFNGAVWLIMTFWLAQVGMGLPLGLGASLWLYALGGLALVVPALFLGLWVTAYTPGKATLIALVMGVVGMGQVLEWSVRLFGDLFYKLLPPWRLPAPTFEQNPAVRGLWESFPGLPTEGFVLSLALMVPLFWAASRLWQEVEA
ncbi:MULTISPECIES: hypothetical protein [Meiothermus]|uniref:Uncharacterized protein n=2 Tax=Meiothermus TaxID=65551 RepID=D3PKN2_MEIRD|nr:MULTISPECIES: hypothetical protein [Meiothermus]ADD28906.1 hypothetical protein Mrub_2152 [Meiothermus ruber DSM 1279]AGK05645.1 hypothetical protein K649_11775 [Meiothermus ruber DSM 1279]AWR86087.1 hypothetical protein Mtai_v1c08430 [Meiothermus taiwanensis WR-220]KIQ55712.1 hypothetical protein SY28_01985 [Meiothermus taiwanensis]MCL6530880.1 hypothetical protein [Meiothermus ruber]